VARAFEAFSVGNLPQAKSEYQRTLKAEPQNGDALNGLAAVALREGQTGLAEEYYLRALQADPRDSTALAGLFGLRGQTDPAQSESRLKSVLAGQPESPALLFALGNLQARQGHWNEAQQTYFKAHTLDAANPDILYNLAISLDQLHQPKLAAQYYGQALTATESRPAGFDRERVAARLRELTPAPAK
jgi:Flp pilus assembly protein TadD